MIQSQCWLSIAILAGVVQIKMYYFKDKGSYNVGEYDSFKIREEIDEFVSLKKYDYLRTSDFVIYNPNKRTRTKQNLKIRRAVSLISKETGDLVRYNEDLKIAFTKDKSYVFAEKVQSMGEYEYYLTKFSGLKNPVIISLTKSQICRYVELDTKTIYDYYKHNFVFPKWFRRFLKMRALRVYSSMGFNFNSRRYNDTKHSAEEKFRHDFVKRNMDIYKVYFTLARMLDSKLDRCGKGFPIKGLMYLVLDIDGKCDGIHLVDNRGICIKCLEDSNAKLAKTIEKIRNIPNLIIIKQLFSGTKGWHLHMEFNGKREVSEEVLRGIIKFINSEENLVDWFDGKEIDGVRQFDTSRIMKLCDSIDITTGCIVREEIKRLNLNDQICEPKAMN